MTLVRMLFTATFAGATAVAAGIVYRRTRRPAATAVVLLHPAIVLGSIAGGHNDILVGLGLLGATVLLLDDRPVAAGLAAGAATLVKLTGGIGILGARGVGARPPLPADRHRVRGHGRCAGRARLPAPRRVGLLGLRPQPWLALA